MVRKTTSFVLAGILLASIVFSAGFVSAGWKEIFLFDQVMQRSNDYDIVWEGPYKGGNLMVAFNGNNGNSLVTSFENIPGNFDTLVYEKTNYRDYSSSYRSPSYSYYRPYHTYYPSHSYYPYRQNYYWNRRGYSNYVRDNSERIYIDKTNLNEIRGNVAIRQIELADNIDARRNALEDNKDARRTALANEADTRRIELAREAINSYPHYDANLGYYNWRY